ncbi:uncharacterized protein LOC113354161 [Papaver somniferum]|uniref:uncharacterized protein LOC113354161 n=1 Tax=Papaver somniferum TaxID=3469 RepID=UPI000E6FAA8C|nr:uncharacterized protein LOC113354161 [Papaver somniferum]
MAEDWKSLDWKGKGKMVDVDIESRIHWYPTEYCVDCLYYGIAFPQGCESPDFRENFSWYLDDLQHNVNVKIDECLQQEEPPGIVHELFVDSPVDRLVQFFSQPKSTPINQGTSNPFLVHGAGVDSGGGSHPFNGEIGESSNPPGDVDMSDVDASEGPSPTVKPRLYGSEDDDWILYTYHPRKYQTSYFCRNATTCHRSCSRSNSDGRRFCQW